MSRCAEFVESDYLRNELGLLTRILWRRRIHSLLSIRTLDIHYEHSKKTFISNTVEIIHPKI